jgi:hypothetical protein
MERTASETVSFRIMKVGDVKAKLRAVTEVAHDLRLPVRYDDKAFSDPSYFECVEGIFDGKAGPDEPFVRGAIIMDRQQLLGVFQRSHPETKACAGQ